MDIIMLTASRIKELRNSLGFSAKAVATDLGIAISNYSMLENGKVEITLARLQALSEIFKIPVEAFITNTSNNQTYNISNGDNSVSASQVNHYNDKELILTLKQSMHLIERMLQQKGI
jgi:transcriptional regulator with XRE-family HTH domain